MKEVIQDIELVIYLLMEKLNILKNIMVFILLNLDGIKVYVNITE